MKISSFILSRRVPIRTRNLPQIGRVWSYFSHDDLLWDSRKSASFSDNSEDDPSGQYRLLFLEVRHITFLGRIASFRQRDIQAAGIHHSTDRVRSREIAVYREQWRTIVAYSGTQVAKTITFEILCFFISFSLWNSYRCQFEIKVKGFLLSASGALDNTDKLFFPKVLTIGWRGNCGARDDSGGRTSYRWGCEGPAHG